MSLEEIADRCDRCSTEEREAFAEWRGMTRRGPDRSEFIISGLTSRNRYVREWTFDEVARDFDPRKWDPKDVAAAIVALERLDADPGPERLEQATELYRLLGRIGQLRLIGLAHLERVGILGMNIPYTGEDLKARPNPAHVRGSIHFWGEPHLYAEEWVAGHGVKDMDALMKAMPDSLKEHMARRWRETDEAAPHPDMDAVGSELKKLRSSPVRKRSKGGP